MSITLLSFYKEIILIKRNVGISFNAIRPRVQTSNFSCAEPNGKKLEQRTWIIILGSADGYID
jgi:hypothetical protein